MAKAWSSLTRANVIGKIDKLAKALPNVELQKHYQWLCNTVHPSAGGTFAFSSPIMMHDAKTHAYVWHHSAPLSTSDGSKQSAERNVQEAVVTAAVTAVTVLKQTLDDALRIIDDVALTAKAPKMACFEYWRRVQVTTRKQMCPADLARLRRTVTIDGVVMGQL